MRDQQRLIVDTRKFFKDRRGLESYLYFNWGESENEGMNQSYVAVKALLGNDAPKGIRWTIERARDANHQQTPFLALPSALHDYFTGGQKQAWTPTNRTERTTSVPAPVNQRRK